MSEISHVCENVHTEIDGKEGSWEGGKLIGVFWVGAEGLSKPKGPKG